MATQSEWIAEAEKYERKAQEAYEAGDLDMAEHWTNKARACRFCAAEGTDDNE